MDAHGNNALIREAQNGHLDTTAENEHIRVVKLLIKKGAKITIKDDYGKKALDIVKGKKMEKISNAKLFPINHWEVLPDKNYETDLKVWKKNDPNRYIKVQELVDYIRLDPF
ncbi:hypothetical protein PIROE2DRAFT_7334 [Piromyces sp. E2]|nr:hypothetical protein PIROE2DRAFT_7334 [Piromyces sp. E2]|eukprot:OUM65584.1 hypothetical protein PIROE2DRAFT_7334 [Piromyces sp. E2]